MNIRGETVFQLFKYAVYALLTLNVYLFFREEYLAAKLQFPDGVSASHLIDAYASTIDTAAWVLLLLLFELETYVLDESQYTRRVTMSLHALRVFCYSFIVYAFYGYLVNLDFVYGTAPLAGISDICALAGEGWSYAVSLDEYADVTAANCAAFSDLVSFHRFDTMPAVVDAPGLADIRILAWVDALNAGVWLLVVLLLEIDVRLQERDRYTGLAFRISTACKVVLYTILLLAAILWGVKGSFVDFWDAFLWLVAFVFIEHNVFEWRQESLDEESGVTPAPGTAR